MENIVQHFSRTIKPFLNTTKKGLGSMTQQLVVRIYALVRDLTVPIYMELLKVRPYGKMLLGLVPIWDHMGNVVEGRNKSSAMLAVREARDC